MLFSDRNMQLFGIVGGIIVDILYLGSVLNLLRLIYKCATTEPGIIPAIPSQTCDLMRLQSVTKDGIHVEYKT